MTIIYLLGVKLYGLAILIASLWNDKAAKFIQGRKGLFRKISSEVSPDENLIWVHCSSLGEYEQGKPLIQSLKQNYPDHKIFLTLFSPSGYENLAGRSLGDHIFYLPLDGPRNARRLMKWMKPKMAFFIKYEYWYYYLNELNKRKIPAFVVSAIFRPNMRYFKWYGGFFKKLLFMVDHLFVQDKESQTCLYDNNITHASVSGDTRFDTVWNNFQNRKENVIVKNFVSGGDALVAGSTWPDDEDLLLQLVQDDRIKCKMIIAPHELGESRIQQLQQKCLVKSIRYSSIEKGGSAADADVLIIDNIGMLSGLYAYGQIAYIGGGFGKGIHNTLEAAVFGVPVIFGPRYKTFREAVNLVSVGAAFSINTYEQLFTKVELLLSQRELLRRDQRQEQCLHRKKQRCI